MKIQIIGISGKSGVGKSTLADHLLFRLLGWEKMAFADPLKTECAITFDFPRVWCDNQEDKLRVVPGFLVDGRAITVRELMQRYGMAKRAEDKDYWIKKMRESLIEADSRGVPGVAIHDVRMPNEAKMVRDMGGFLVRLEPYPGWVPGPHADHTSETALDDWKDWDRVFTPSFGELEFVAGHILGQGGQA